MVGDSPYPSCKITLPPELECWAHTAGLPWSGRNVLKPSTAGLFLSYNRFHQENYTVLANLCTGSMSPDSVCGEIRDALQSKLSAGCSAQKQPPPGPRGIFVHSTQHANEDPVMLRPPLVSVLPLQDSRKAEQLRSHLAQAME